MIRSLTLKNFQAWDSVTLDLSPITVIIGETNAGKSSLLRAVSCVLFNAIEGQAMVRHGATVAEVSLELEDGLLIGWARGANVNRYTVGNDVYDKPGRSVPPAVQDALQIHELEFDGEVVRLQWAPQMDAPFLLSDSGAKATRMLGVAGNAAVVAQAARIAQQETKSQQDALKAAVAQRDALSLRLESFKNVEAAAPIAEALRQAVQQLAETADRYRALRELHDQHQAARPRRHRLDQSLQDAEALVDRLQRFTHTTWKLGALVSGQAVLDRRRVLSEQLVLAESLQEAWRQTVRLQEIQDTLISAASIHASKSTLLDNLDLAMEHYDHCYSSHQDLVESMTCPTCGRVKEVA